MNRPRFVYAAAMGLSRPDSRGLGAAVRALGAAEIRLSDPEEALAAADSYGLCRIEAGVRIDGVARSSTRGNRLRRGTCAESVLAFTSGRA